MSAWTDLLEQPAVLRLGTALVHFLWQGAALAVAAMLVLAVMRRRSAHARYAVALVFFGAMALCPIVTVLAWHADPAASSLASPKPGPVVPAALPPTAHDPSIPLDPSSSATAPPSVPEWETQPIQGTVLIAPRTNGDHHRFSLTGARAWLNRRLAWVVAFWLAGVTVLSLRLLVGWAGVARMRRRGVQPVDEACMDVVQRLTARLGIRRPVRVLQSALAEVPTVLGWLKPVVLLPASAMTGLSAAQLEAILAHELAHVRRHDYLVNVLQTVVETLLFYHPAVWWLSRRLRREREHCCDDLAVALCGDRLLYARALTTLEASRPPHPALAATATPLLSRIRRLVGVPPAPSHLRPWWPAAALTLGAILALTTALRLSGASDAPSVFTSQHSGAASETDESPIEPHDPKPTSSTSVPLDTPEPRTSQEKRQEDFALSQSRAWYILSQTDTNGLLHGLPQRLGKVIVPSRRKEKAWAGVENGGRLELEIGVDGDVEGEIFVGFFADPRWYLAEPVQVRSFPGPGSYTVEKLIPGRYVLGAMIGELPRPNALGVHARWPAAVQINAAQTAKARLLLSTEFENRPGGAWQELEGFAGHWEKMDPARMITVRTVDEKGRAMPFCRVTFVDRDETTTREFHETGTDDSGFAYCDKIDNTFSVCSARYDFLPELMANRGYYKKIEQLHDASNRPVVTVEWDDFPTGTGKVTGRVHNQHGRPLDEYYITLTRSIGERLDWSDFASYWIHVPIIDAEGRYEVGGLPPGTYSMRVRHFDYPTHVYDIAPEEQPTFTIPDEENALVEFDVEVEAKALLYGRAVYEDGTPVHPASWTAWFERWTPEQRRQYGPWPGRYFALGLEPDGSFRVCLSAKEREDLLKNSEGMIEITAVRETIVDGEPRHVQHKLGQVHIDKLSPDKDKPAKVVLPRAESLENGDAAQPADGVRAPIKQAGSEAPAPEADTAARLTAFKLLDTNGKSYRLADYVRKPVLLNFFATWCGPCDAERPHLVATHEKYADRGLVILHISRNEEPQLVEDFAARERLPFPVLLDESAEFYKLVKAWAGHEPKGIPTNVLLDREHRIVFSDVGFTQGKFAKLEEAIKRLLPDDEPSGPPAGDAQTESQEAGAEPQATYKGKPVRHWIEALKAEDRQQRDGALRAIVVMMSSNQIGDALVDAVPDLIGLLDDDDPFARELAALALSQVGPAAEKAVPALIAGLEDSNAGVRRRSALALGKIGPAAAPAVPALLRLLEHDGDIRVRADAADALGRIGPASQSAVEPLMRRLRGGNRPWLRLRMPRALGGIGKPAVPSLVAALEDQDATIRWLAAESLSYAGPEADAAIPALIAALKDPDSGVRIYAALALGKIGPDAADAIPALAELLDDKEGQGPSQRRFIVMLMPFRKETNVGRAAALALGRIGPAAVPTLIDAIQHEDPLVGRWAIEGLEEAGPAAEAAVPQLIAALKGELYRSTGSYSSWGGVSGGAVGALGKIGKGAVPALIEALANEDPTIRAGAACALQHIGPEATAAVPALIEATDDKERSVRLQTARALEAIGPDGKAAAPALVKALSDPSFWVRWRASEALGKIDDRSEATLTALIEALGDDFHAVRGTAAENLEAFGPRAKSAVPALTSMAKDSEEGHLVRRRAIRALGTIGPDAADAVPALVEIYAHDLDARKRSEAFFALQKISPDRLPREERTP